MKGFLSILVILCLCASAHASTFQIGDRDIEIPVPEGFTVLTPEIGILYELLKQGIPENVELLVSTAPIEYVAKSMEGEAPSTERLCYVTVFTAIKNIQIDQMNFQAIEKEYKTIYGDFTKQTELAIKDGMNKIGERLSERLDAEVASDSSIAKPVWLYSADNAFCFSILMKAQISVNEESIEGNGIILSTILNVSGKIITLTVQDLETNAERASAASLAWARDILKSNGQSIEQLPAFIESE